MAPSLDVGYSSFCRCAAVTIPFIDAAANTGKTQLWRILPSRPITFVLGQAKTEFTIHADALTPISKALRVLIDGDMKEAKEACVTWDDVDSETFIRFAQWVYTNDYAPPDPDILLDSSNFSFQPAPSNNSSGQPKENNYSIQDISDLWRIPDHAFQPRPNTEGCEEYSKIFLCYANLYILADKYDITELSKLSMHKLYTTLVTFKLYHSCMSDILSLVELVYENTRDDDELRSMIVHYCACTVERLASCEEFQKTLQGYPEFSSALVAKMTERLD
ncbi:hypothetical protein PG987_010858 [Apiospora arundinis]